MKIYTVVFFITFFFVFNTEAQTPRERRERIRSSVEKRDTKTAIEELKAFRNAEAALFAFNNYDYLLARLSEMNEDKGAATANYQAIVQRNSILAQYALWHLAGISRMTGNGTLEREQLRQFLVIAPNSLMRQAAYARLAQSLFESNDYTGAIQMLKPIADSKASSSSRKALLLLAQSYSNSNQKELAREAFTKLISEMPNLNQPDDYALEAAKALDAIEGGKETEAPQLAEPDHLRRALIYQFNRDFKDARLHYNAIVTRYPNSSNAPESLYQTGRGFFNERDYENAIVPLQKLVQSFPNSSSAQDATNLLASAYGRMKRFDEAVATYKQAIEKFPSTYNPERPFLNLIDTLRDAGRDQEALQWVETTRSKFDGELASTLALFSKARILFSQGNWSGVITICDALKAEGGLGNLRVAGSTTQKEIALMQAFALEQTGRADEAINAYLAIADGRNEYHGWQATMRLQAMMTDSRFAEKISQRFSQLVSEADNALKNNQPDRARVAAQNAIRLTKDDTARKNLLDVLRRAYAQLPAYNKVPNGQFQQIGRQEIITGPTQQTSKPTHQALADELLFLGLYDEAAPELGYAVSKEKQNPAPSSPDMAYTLAVLYKRGDHADKAVTYSEPLWRNVPADYALELAPRESVELLYPAPYQTSLLKHAPQRNVDARFILSIMRQESRYKPEIKSYAAARGLMQFISATANQIAAQLNKEDFKQDELYDPDTAVQFGSQYLSNLFTLFPQKPEAVAASYNGGEDNMARWLARSRSNDAARYVPEIAFSQSKDYVFKVLSNYRVYQTLYDERLQSY